jgi:hypothetical protein
MAAVRRREPVARNAERFAVGEPVATANGLRGDVVVLGAHTRDARGAAAGVTVTGPLALAPSARPRVRLVLDRVRESHGYSFRCCDHEWNTEGMADNDIIAACLPAWTGTAGYV